MTFENIRRAAAAETEARNDKDRYFIQDGHEYDKDAGIKWHSTATRWNQYKAGTITREKAVELATIRSHKHNAAELEKGLTKITRIENAGDLISLTISIDWKRSTTWGSNPTAEMRYSYIDKDGNRCGSNITGSSVGGCGYDKESTAAAQVLNACPEVLKVLYIIAEENPGENLHDLFGYGSGYDYKPAFEGGVGISCFRNIFENVGFDWHTVASGKTYDVYTAERRI